MRSYYIPEDAFNAWKQVYIKYGITFQEHALDFVNDKCIHNDHQFIDHMLDNPTNDLVVLGSFNHLDELGLAEYNDGTDLYKFTEKFIEEIGE